MGLVSNIAFRAGELARFAVSPRGPEGSRARSVGALLRLAFVAAVSAAALLFGVPAVLCYLGALKGDMSSALSKAPSIAEGVLSSGLDYARHAYPETVSALALPLYALAVLACALLAAYALSGRASGGKRNVFGTLSPSKGGARQGAGVETSHVVLASITRTWRPGSRIRHAGLVIGYSPLLHRYYLSGPDAHTQTVAPPGIGKTTRMIYPTIHAILCSEDSAIVYDPKGELYDNTSASARASGAKVVVIDYGNWRRSDLYNPLSEITRAYEENMALYRELMVDAAASSGKDAEELALRARNARIDALSRADSLAADLSEAMIPDIPGGEAFWRPSARTLLRAMALFVAVYDEAEWEGRADAPTTPAPEQRSLKSVRHLLDLYGKAQRRKVGSSVEDWVPLEGLFEGLSPEHPARRAFTQAKNTPGQTLGGIMSTLLAELDKVVDEQSAMMGYATGFSFEDIGRERTVVYLIVPEESPAKFSYVPVFTAQAYQAFARLARKSGGSMPRWVHFVQEETGNFPAIPRYANMIGTGRGYGMRFHAVVQTPAQWENLYGKVGAKIISDNMQLTNWVKIKDGRDAKALSDAVGQVSVEVSSTSTSAPASALLGPMSGSTSTSRRTETVPFLPVDKVLSWDPARGSFVQRAQIDRSTSLNRILFRRREAKVALFPTVPAKHQPTLRAFGINSVAKSRAKALAAQAEDRSASKVVVPPWSASALTDSERARVGAELSAGSLDRRTRADFEAQRARRAATGAGEMADRAFREEPPEEGEDAAAWVARVRAAEAERVRREMATANRLVAAMEFAAGLSKPWSCDGEGFVSSRSAMREAWMAEFARRARELFEGMQTKGDA